CAWAIPGARRPKEAREKRKVRRASGRRLDVIRVPEKGGPPMKIKAGPGYPLTGGEVYSPAPRPRRASRFWRLPLLGQLEPVRERDVRRDGLAVARPGRRELVLLEGLAGQLVEAVPRALGDGHAADVPVLVDVEPGDDVSLDAHALHLGGIVRLHLFD